MTIVADRRADARPKYDFDAIAVKKQAALDYLAEAEADKAIAQAEADERAAARLRRWLAVDSALDHLFEQYREQTGFSVQEYRFVDHLLDDMYMGEDGYVPTLLSPEGRRVVREIKDSLSPYKESYRSDLGLHAAWAIKAHDDILSGATAVSAESLLRLAQYWTFVQNTLDRIARDHTKHLGLISNAAAASAAVA